MKPVRELISGRIKAGLAEEPAPVEAFERGHFRWRLSRRVRDRAATVVEPTVGGGESADQPHASDSVSD